MKLLFVEKITSRFNTDLLDVIAKFLKNLDLIHHNRFQTPCIQTPHFHIIWGMKNVPKTKSIALSLRHVFARNIRLVRANAGMSQESMAAEAGLDRAFVGTLERGQRNISIDNIELIANAIGMAPHELMHPDLAQIRRLDITITRAPRTVRPYPVKKR